MNYYNENDAEKAAWLRELIRQNVVAPGEVDERSIQQVAAADLRGFRQCHFFAGVGVWSYALRLAGWPDDRPVWTGSCPCPSFSAAGKGEGFDDPRHLWPAWYRLIPQSNPPTLFGEQADDAIGYGWLDLVQTDLERAHYAVGKAVLGACSVGAPHIRQRLYFCAHATGSRQSNAREHGSGLPLLSARSVERGGIVGSADAMHAERRSLDGPGQDGCDGAHARWQEAHGEPRARSETRDSLQPDSERSFARRETSTTVGHGNPTDAASSSSERNDTDFGGSQVGQTASDSRIERSDRRRSASSKIGAASQESGTSLDGSNATKRRLAMHRSASGDAGHFALTSQPGIGSQSIGAGLEGFSGDVREWRGPGWLDPLTARSVAAAGATRGFWRDCDWWHARDEKYRPIERGLFPLVTGASNRVLKLRGYGDAIVPQVAAAFIESYLEASEGVRE